MTTNGVEPDAAGIPTSLRASLALLSRLAVTMADSAGAATEPGTIATMAMAFEELVEEISGVKAVQNNLRVKPPT